MRIQVIKNSPEKNQNTDVANIENILGEVFIALNFDEQAGEVSIYSEKHGGKIVLNKDEYKII